MDDFVLICGLPLQEMYTCARHTYSAETEYILMNSQIFLKAFPCYLPSKKPQQIRTCSCINADNQFLSIKECLGPTSSHTHTHTLLLPEPRPIRTRQNKTGFFLLIFLVFFYVTCVYKQLLYG